MESIWKLLRERVTSGATAEDATDAVLAPYGELRLAEFARPAILRAAEIESRNHARTVERGSFDPTRGSEAYRAKCLLNLPKLVFKVEGVRVTWEEATAAQHKARVAFLETQIMGIQETQRQHLCAIELIEEHNVDRLRDVPDWENLMAQKMNPPEAQVSA